VGQVVGPGLGNTSIDDSTDSQLVIDPSNNSQMIQRSSVSNGRYRNGAHSGIIFDEEYKDLSVCLFPEGMNLAAERKSGSSNVTLYAISEMFLNITISRSNLLNTIQSF
jgi:hypothetical protein